LSSTAQPINTHQKWRKKSHESNPEPERLGKQPPAWPLCYASDTGDGDCFTLLSFDDSDPYTFKLHTSLSRLRWPFHSNRGTLGSNAATIKPAEVRKSTPLTFVSNAAASDLLHGHRHASARALSGCIKHQRSVIRRSVYGTIVDITRDLPKSWHSSKLKGLWASGTRL